MYVLEFRKDGWMYGRTILIFLSQHLRLPDSSSDPACPISSGKQFADDYCSQMFFFKKKGKKANNRLNY